MFPDRPHWTLAFSEHPIHIRVGMHLRHKSNDAIYRVEKLNFKAEAVEVRPLLDDCSAIEVSFEEVSQDYRPTLLEDTGEILVTPPSWERLPSFPTRSVA